MNIIAANLTLKEGVQVSELGDVIKHEQAMVEKWRVEGKLFDMYLKQQRNGAFLMFKEMDQPSVQALIETLPLFPYFQSVTYLELMKS